MANSKFFQFFITFGLSLLIVGCGYRGFYMGIPYGAKHNPEMGYVMGRFYMEKYFTGTIILELRNVDSGDAYDIGLYSGQNNGVLLREISPGKYKIEGFRIDRYQQNRNCPVGAMSFKISESGFNKFGRDFQVQKGAIYYIGDFKGNSERVYPSKNMLVNILAGCMYFTWEIKSIVNNYNETIKEFNNSYTNFTGKPIGRIFE